MSLNGQLEKPPAALRPLREQLSRESKALSRTAAELEQTALFAEPEFEEALLLPQEEVEKRYTAENAKQIEWRRKACVKLLARQMPAEDIADILSMNHRTVGAIASQEYMKIAGFSEQYADALLSDAASTLAIARGKRESAPYNQLMFGAGVLMTHAAAIKLIGAGVGELEAVDVETEDPRRREFIERLKQIAPPKTNGETSKAEMLT